MRRRACYLVPLILLLMQGCGYPELSEGAYKHATALYAICNQKDQQRLERYAPLLQQAESKGEITSKEAKWLNDVVKQARAGDWEDAAAEAWEMLSANVKEK